MFSVYIAVEGFTLPGKFIVKELTLLFENEEFNHFIFEAPDNFTPSSKEKTTIRYTTNNIHGLKYTDGFIPYSKLEEVISKLHNCDVYCYGINTVNLIQRFIPYTPVTNIQNCGYTMPSTLPQFRCCRVHRARHCTLAKATAIKEYCNFTNC